MTAPAGPVLGRPADQDRRDQQTLNYEHALEAAALAATLAAIAGAVGMALALVSSGVPVPVVRQRLVAALRAVPVEVESGIRARWQQGVALGASNALTDLGGQPVATSSPAVRDVAAQVTLADADTAKLLATVDRDLRAGLDQAITLAQTLPLDTPADVTAVQAKATQAVNHTRAQISWVAQSAVHAGTVAVAEQADAWVVWVAERDACCIPGTRVSAPSVLGPTTPARLVPEDETQRLTLDPSTLGLSLDGESRTLPTSAMAEAVGDLSDVLGVSERDYVGEVVTIRTASGKEFTGTPNHPVATRTGWASLSELKVGDHVLSRRRGKGRAAGVEPDLNNVQPRIEEVAKAFQGHLPSRVMPVAAEDFHGDGSGTEVGVVWAHRLLGDGGDAALVEHGGQEPFSGTDAATARLDGCGCLDLGFEAPASTSIGCDCGSDDSGPPLGVELVGSAEVPPSDQAVSLEPAPDRVHVDAIEYGDFLGRLAVLVEPDEIVEIRLGQFRGHVYNLETVEGWYLSEDIVSHNCLVCLSLSGHAIKPGDTFDAHATFGQKPMPLFPIGDPQPLIGPPRHPNCRCATRLYTGDPESKLGLPATLRREAERSVARGFSNHASKKARLKAADRLVRRANRLPKSVNARAKRDVARGDFSDRHNEKLPALPPGRG